MLEFFKKGLYERFDWIIISVDNTMLMVEWGILKIFKCRGVE